MGQMSQEGTDESVRPDELLGSDRSDGLDGSKGSNYSEGVRRVRWVRFDRWVRRVIGHGIFNLEGLILLRYDVARSKLKGG